MVVASQERMMLPREVAEVRDRQTRRWSGGGSRNYGGFDQKSGGKGSKRRGKKVKAPEQDPNVYRWIKRMLVIAEDEPRANSGEEEDLAVEEARTRREG